MELLGENAVILNPDKLRFSQRIVDFAGFRLSKCDLEPLQNIWMQFETLLLQDQ